MQGVSEMIITRTPFRISFLGGGTDYPTWYQEHGGAVLSTTINRYCYLTVRRLPPFFDYRHRIVWSQTETVNRTEDIQHPVIRALLPIMDMDDGVEILHNADLPARTGLGSSSTFTVGLIHALTRLNELDISARELAKQAIFVEQSLLRDPVGIQDQISAAYGNLNRINISKSGQFRVIPMDLARKRQNDFENHLLLFYTGISRFSAEAAADTIKNIPKKNANLHRIQEMVDEGCEILQSDGDLNDFGLLLHEGWQLKRGLSTKISSDSIDDIYARAIKAGATGGKLLGAGGGGFLLFFAPPERHEGIKNALDGLLHVPIKIDNSGATVLYHSQHQTSSPLLFGE